MTDIGNQRAARQAIRQRGRAWARRPERPIPYGPFARFSDWWCAGRDARRALPDLPLTVVEIGADNLDPAVGGAHSYPDRNNSYPGRNDSYPDGNHAHPHGYPGAREFPVPADGSAIGILVGTPRMGVLAQLGRGRVEREWVRYKADVADALVRLSEVRARRNLLAAELPLAQERLIGLPERPSDEELARRVGGEADTDELVVRDRRLRRHQQARSREEAAVRDLRDRIADLDVEVARVGEPVRIRFEVAQARAAWILAHTRRRCAAYLSRLVRRHPTGRKINERLRPYWPELPGWASGDRSPDLSDLPGSIPTGRVPPVGPPPAPVAPTPTWGS